MNPTHRGAILLVLTFFLLHWGTPVFGQEPRRITIAAEPDYPPYSFVDELGAPTGFAVELFQAAARAMGLEIEIRIDYWSNIRNDLAEGRIDALPLVGRTPERAEIFDFTFPYLSLHGGVVVRDGDERFRRFEDLAGHRIAVMAADNAEEFLSRQEMDHERRTFPTFSAAFDDLSAGGSDAVVIQRLVALRLIQEGSFPDLRLLDEPITDFRQDFCFAVTEGDRELLAVLNEGLSLVIASGAFRRLQTKWFSPLELPTRRILVGGDESYPPFEFLDDQGNPAGFNVDLTRAIAREMGFEVEIKLGPWSQITAMLARGEIDLIQGMMYSPERDRVFDFAHGHTIHQHVVVGRSGGRRGIPSSLEELRGRSIAVQDGDIMHEFALQNGLAGNLHVVETQETALGMVASGQIDYALGSRLAAMHLIRENGWDNLDVGRQSLVSQEYGFAVLSGNMGMLSTFSEGLAVVQESGEYHDIHHQWLGGLTPVTYSVWQVSRVALLSLVPVLIVLTGIIAWNRSLRKQVLRSTAELRRNVQRTQWLNTIATSYLLRRNASSLFQHAIATLDDNFTGVRTVLLVVDSNGVLKSERNAGVLSQGVSLASDPALLDSFRRESRVVLDSTSETLVGQGVRAMAAVLIQREGERRRFLAFLGSAPQNWSDHELLTLEEHANMLTIILENETNQNRINTANRTLESSLHEKETLLKEVHHRVKNNLNVIVSLLRLQEDQIDSVESARGAFEQSRNRIYSMALVHESLYRSENLAEIELDQYIRKLVDQLRESFSGHRDIRYTCNLAPIKMDITRAVPCGIIINELVSNAQKHAFPGARSGEITVSLVAKGPSAVVLTIRDDGIGMPEQFSGSEAKTLGLQLIDVLSAQIRATLTFSTDGGTQVELLIPHGANG
jgi:ABC-type amino acid transport substrate-binding protein/two-component sensor histidine kinase